MIRLVVEPYCNNCPEFEATKDVFKTENFAENQQDYVTYISCEHEDRCRSIVEYLKGEINYEEKANKTDPIVPCDICNHGTWDDCDSIDNCPVRNSENWKG